MCFEKAVKAKPKARDKGTLFYMRIEIMSKLNWTTNDMAYTDSHSYRIEAIGNSHRVIYSARGEYPVFQSSNFDSVEAAKQSAQNHHNKYGADNE